jgi:hypothetical protein
LNDGAVAAVSQYALVAGNDFAERDPSSWRMEGRLTVDSPWMVLDVRTEQQLGVRLCRNTYDVAQPRACVAYRLVVTSTAAATNCVQLTGWELRLSSSSSAIPVLTSADRRALTAALRTVRTAANAATATALLSKILRAVLDQPSNDKLRCGPPSCRLLSLPASRSDVVCSPESKQMPWFD